MALIIDPQQRKCEKCPSVSPDVFAGEVSKGVKDLPETAMHIMSWILCSGKILSMLT